MFEYRVTEPDLPPPSERAGSNTPRMDYRDMEWWLNHMANHGWEFVSYGETHWVHGSPQSWWIFRRERSA